MKYGLALAVATAAFGSAAMAHPGAHVHPHDGANWLVVVSALAVIAVAGGLAMSRTRSRK